MKTEKIEIGGMNCESCERLITKSVTAAGGKVQQISASQGFAVVEYPDGARGGIDAAIESAGYEVGGKSRTLEPIEAQLLSFLSDFVSGKPNTALVRTCFAYTVASFFLLSAGLYFVFGSPNKYAAYYLYAALSSVAVGGAFALFRAYKSVFNCMEGMMIGMTIGMSAGFLFGAITGATNGMFVGSVFGMAVGMALGSFAGRCCGIMGVMEGLMAGLMGGTMGAMLTVMMQYDNLALFMPLFVLSCLALLAGLKYMIYYYAGKRIEGKLMPFTSFFALALLLTALTVAVIMYAPHVGIAIGVV